MNEFDNQYRRETPEETALRLRAKIAAGESYLKPELAEALMQSAQRSAAMQQFEDAILRIDEALAIVEKLIEEGQVEFRTSLGRCFLFRSAVIRFYRGPEAGLVAFNETIHYFTEKADRDDPITQNELAIALMNKADILMNPLGAYSAAMAAQEQAAKIWRRLLNTDGSEFRQQFVSALLACGDLKTQSGDAEKALRDFQEAVETIQDGITDGCTEFYPVLIQALLKLTKLYEQLGDLPHAFDSLRESIQVVRNLVADGDHAAKIMLTTLYLQHGILYERIGNSAAALEEFDRCRDIYYETFRLGDMPTPGNYILRTGLANVLMCRGNMLADLKRFDEATAAFDESVRQYQRSTEFRPEDDDDETFIPYSIGVVRLNHANMLVAQGKLDEAVAIKEKALQALCQRMEAGHEEILPNLLSAYRKMIDILRMKGETEEMVAWTDRLIEILETAVDDGKLEYRGNLASAYQLRCTSWEERNLFAAAEQDAIRSLRLFRSIADEESDATEIHVAKIQWSELLEHIAVLQTRQNRIGEAIQLFQNAIDDVTGLFNEGNKPIVFDVLLASSQFVNFVEAIIRSSNFSDVPIKEGNLPEHILQRLKNLSKMAAGTDTAELPEGVTQHTPEDFRAWIDKAMEVCAVGIELSRQQQIESKEPTMNVFFSIKIAFFRKTRASFFLLLDENEKACDELALSVEEWESLLMGLEKLKAQNRYFAAEAGDRTIPATDDPYRDRYLYYVGELRQTLQRWANTSLTLQRFEEAEQLFNREIDLARKLIQQEIPDADRFLMISLMSYAKSVEDSFSVAKTIALFDEARQLIRERFRNGTVISDDYSMFRHIHVSYALFLIKCGKSNYVTELMDYYTEEIEKSREFPSPEIWLELCHALDVHSLWLTDPAQLKTVRTRQRKLLAQHPDFASNTQLQEWDKQLAKEIEKT